MTELDRAFLRRLAGWRADGVPVSTLYLDVDGRRYPRRQDVIGRAEVLSRELERQAQGLDRDRRCSVTEDADRMLEFLRTFDRGSTRGVAMFSASGARLWQPVEVPRPVPDLAVLADHPYVLRLEVLVETYESFCTVIVDREKARIFLASMGRIEERTDVLDDVPGQHDQGGWSQARFRRHIEDHVGHHLKHVADVLFHLQQERGFDHLIVAGPDALLPAFEAALHDYVRQRIASRTTLSMTAGVDEVLTKSLAVEEAVEVGRERAMLERLKADAAAGRPAVLGLEASLEALNEGRVDTLVVPFGTSFEGVRCVRCGRLAVRGQRCRTCGGRVEPVPDVVESAVAAALRQRSRVEALSFTAPESPTRQDVGALLRY